MGLEVVLVIEGGPEFWPISNSAVARPISRV